MGFCGVEEEECEPPGPLPWAPSPACSTCEGSSAGAPSRALEMFPWSRSCGSGTARLCVNACACLSSLLSQLNRNSLHKACLSHMTLNIHRPVSFSGSSVCFQARRGRGCSSLRVSGQQEAVPCAGDLAPAQHRASLTCRRLHSPTAV